MVRASFGLGLKQALMCSSGDIPEFEWTKIKELEFQEWYKERNALMTQLANFQCTKCPDLTDHVSLRYF
jgi:antiviral helicase SKI2